MSGGRRVDPHVRMAAWLLVCQLRLWKKACVASSLTTCTIRARSAASPALTSLCPVLDVDTPDGCLRPSYGFVKGS